ncbi:MAG: DUF58 domain-containing protein [Gammaproteobacteria bacterium]|nr:DUF58 domain-containing protein [Gammaproteobacteria bacterium]
MSNNTKQAEGITWISPQSLIQLRLLANQIPLDSGKIHAKQGGAYISSFKGRGMEFDESRIYQAGDDIRNMDWRVTARTGDAHTKLFREERERPVLLWLDLNASMMFATRNKFKAVIASEIAATIAWSAARNNDRIGGLIFSDTEHIEIKPRRGKTAVLDFIGRCTKHHAWQKTDNPAAEAVTDRTTAVARLRSVVHPGSLVFMISDFRDLSEKAYTHIANIARNNDIIMIKISDPIEIDLPSSGTYKLTDGIKELQIQTSSKKTREEYHQRYLIYHQQISDFCRKNRIHLIEVSTDDNVIDKLKVGLGVNALGKKAQYRRARQQLIKQHG